MSQEDVEWDPPSEIGMPVAQPWSTKDFVQIERGTERIRSRLRRLESSPAMAGLIASFREETGLSLAKEGPMVSERPSGLKRVGITIQWFCPTSGTRMGLGLETSLAHRVIDTLLSHDRSDAQRLLPTTPVEWGFWTVLAARLTDTVNQSNILPRLVLDRVGPDPFDPTGLGPCPTVAWELMHNGHAMGVIRLWVPATLIPSEIMAGKVPDAVSESTRARFGSHLDSMMVQGRVQAGLIPLDGGLQRLRPRLVLPWPDSPLTGTLPQISGPVVCRLGEGPERWSFAASLAQEPDGRKLTILQTPKHAPTTVTKGLYSMSADVSPATSASADLPITLTVELGRLSLSLSRLANLKPGDVLGLMRNSTEPIELTSGDRLVARGELVQMDQELGVRILQILI